MSVNEDPYEMLGIEPDASIEEIKCAYRQAAIRWHPDVSQADPAESERQFKQAAEAYKCALRKTLLAAKEARKARQTRADSDEPIRCGPHPDCSRFTPPKPSPRQRPCRPCPERTERRESRRFTQEILPALLILIIVIPVLIPLISASIRSDTMGPEAYATYLEEQAERERRESERERRESDRSDNMTNTETWMHRNGVWALLDTLWSIRYFLLVFVASVTACAVFLTIRRKGRRPNHIP